MRRSGKAIWAAYSDTGALEVTCGHCGAQPGQWCSRDDGRVRRVPCVERAADGGLIATDSRKHHDFSEPRHPLAEH